MEGLGWVRLVNGANRTLQILQLKFKLKLFALRFPWEDEAVKYHVAHNVSIKDLLVDKLLHRKAW